MPDPSIPLSKAEITNPTANPPRINKAINMKPRIARKPAQRLVVSRLWRESMVSSIFVQHCLSLVLVHLCSSGLVLGLGSNNELVVYFKGINKFKNKPSLYVKDWVL